MDYLEQYYKYHTKSSLIRDIDPANDTLKYVCNRFELNIEQRYWLAFLYACCYSPTTTYYIYNEFPDYENVDINRLNRWWVRNKHNLIFQTDRLRVKTSDNFVNAFASYRLLLNGKRQSDYFSSLMIGNQTENYHNVWKATSNIFTFGRFTLFIYMEMLHVLTGLPMMPHTLILRDADSCRNGVALACNLKELNTHGTKKQLTASQHKLLQERFEQIRAHIEGLNIPHKNIWNIETTLCAYKKFRLGKRYIGFYIERAGRELEKMNRTILTGVDWTPLWQFREETYDHKYLFEKWRKN